MGIESEIFRGCFFEGCLFFSRRNKISIVKTGEEKCEGRNVKSKIVLGKGRFRRKEILCVYFRRND